MTHAFMKLFSNPRAKRSTVFMVLLTWLFALASGVANACLLQAQETHAHSIASADFPLLATAMRRTPPRSPA